MADLIDTTELQRVLDDHEARLKALEAAEPVPPDPQPSPDWDRIIVPGSYGDFAFTTHNERVLFQQGAIVKGVVHLASTNLVIEGLQTTSETSHETPVVIEKDSWGTLRKFTIEQVGFPANGLGYSSISANDDDNPEGGWAGPWTIEDGLVDMRDNGHYGFEIWGVKNLLIQRVTFKGKGGRVSGGNHAENGFMSLPRSHDAVIKNNVFDMSQGCYRVIEVAQMRRMSFVENDVLELFGDVVPMSHEAVGHVVQRNRVKGKGTTPPANSLFVWLTGSGHTITDNRLTNVATVSKGSATGTTLQRNGPTSGPPW